MITEVVFTGSKHWISYCFKKNHGFTSFLAFVLLDQCPYAEIWFLNCIFFLTFWQIVATEEWSETPLGILSLTRLIHLHSHLHSHVTDPDLTPGTSTDCNPGFLFKSWPFDHTVRLTQSKNEHVTNCNWAAEEHVNVCVTVISVLQILPLESILLWHVCTVFMYVIGVKLDNTWAHAPPSPGWRMTVQTKTYKKAGHVRLICTISKTNIRNKT